MADFLQVIENIRAEDASVQRLFEGEGQRVRGAASQPDYSRRLVEAAEFIAAIYAGRRPAHQLREAMSTSDFPQLFGDVLDRQLLANYAETPQTFRNYCRVATVRDFRTVRRLAVNGGEGVLSTIPEFGEYGERSLSDEVDSYAVVKYGARMPFSWESMINDDLDALKDVPARFGRAARRTEERFATTLIADASGPHASLYTSGYANIVNITNGASVTNPALSISGLQDAFLVLSKMVDTGGDPILIDAVELVVPPALEIVASNILNALTINLTTAGGSVVGLANSDGLRQELVAANWMKSRVRLNVNAYLPLISTTNGNTSWYLFANPSNGRPAVEIGFLRGHEAPEIYMKAPNATRIGGGVVGAMDGDFDTDSIQYKVRHVLGGTRLTSTGGYRSTVASNGSGS